ncbi:MAG: hypothetical protein ACRETL_09275 [Gammaproteobacteria bacterium]
MTLPNSPPVAKICFVTTSPLVVQFFLIPHLYELSRTFEVTLIANEDCSLLLKDAPSPIIMMVVPIERKIRLKRDIVAWSKLFYLFAAKSFDAVISVAPKAGLLTMTSAFLARQRWRCHIFQGEVWANRSGMSRFLLCSADWITARFSSEVLVVSRG